MVLMSVDAFERRNDILKLRSRVLQAEQARLDGDAGLDIKTARRKLKERIHKFYIQ